jgi:hypothetical protein
MSVKEQKRKFLKAALGKMDGLDGRKIPKDNGESWDEYLEKVYAVVENAEGLTKEAVFDAMATQLEALVHQVDYFECQFEEVMADNKSLRQLLEHSEEERDTLKSDLEGAGKTIALHKSAIQELASTHARVVHDVLNSAQKVYTGSTMGPNVDALRSLLSELAEK